MLFVLQVDDINRIQVICDMLEEYQAVDIADQFRAQLGSGSGWYQKKKGQKYHFFPSGSYASSLDPKFYMLCSRSAVDATSLIPWDSQYAIPESRQCKHCLERIRTHTKGCYAPLTEAERKAHIRKHGSIYEDPDICQEIFFKYYENLSNWQKIQFWNRGDYYTHWNYTERLLTNPSE